MNLIEYNIHTSGFKTSNDYKNKQTKQQNMGWGFFDAVFIDYVRVLLVITVDYW